MDRQRAVGRAPFVLGARLGHPAARGDHRAVSAHGIADEPGIRGVGDPIQEACGILRQTIHLVQDEDLVEGPVDQRGAELRLVVVGGIGVVDGGNHITLRGKVFRQVAEEESVSRIAVRNDDQRPGACLGLLRRRIAYRASLQRNLRDAVAQEDAFIGAADGVALGRIPDLDRQRAVVVRMWLAGLDVEDVDLILVYEFDRAHANGVRARRGEFGCVRTHPVDPVFLCHRARTHGADDERRDEECFHVPIPSCHAVRQVFSTHGL